jgi:hypothetical protein
MPKASKKNRLVLESRKSFTNFPQETFNAWQAAGRFPKNFKNFEEMVAAYNASISGGMSPTEARKDLGIKFNAFKKQGNEYSLDNRIIRTELDPWTEQLIDLSSGPESGKLEAKRQRREFTFGVPEEQARLAESNLSMPRSPDDPIYYHKGHLWAAADPNIPGSDDAENVWSEIGRSNILHKDKPRFHPSFMEAAGIPRGKVEAYYNRKALESGARRASGLYGPPPQQILDSLDRLIYERAKAIAQYTGKQAYDVWELATDLDFEPQLNEGFPIKNYDQALALANQAQLDRSSGVNPDTWLNQLAGTTSRGDAAAQSGSSRIIQKGTTVTKYKTPKTGYPQKMGMYLMPDPREVLKAVRENPRGAAAGVAVSALNPEIAQAVEQNNLGAAGNILARDVALGTLGEMGLKKALPLAGKYAPALAKIGGVAGTAGTGAALFLQGQSGSLTDVLARKAAQNPVSFMPAVKANPETDIGARASRAIVNEAKYLSKQAAQTAQPLIKAVDNELRWLGKAGQRAFNSVFGKREI